MLAAALVCASVGAAPVKVSVGGTAVEVGARTEGAAILGQILPLVRALGGTGELSADSKRLSGRTFDGKPFRADVGGASITVGDRSQGLGAPLRVEGGQVVGPLVDVATALGARASFAKAQDELRIAPRLTQVELHAAEEGAVTEVRVTGPSPAKLEHISQPPKAYADFPGLTWVGGSEAIQTGGTGGLYRVRWALFQEWPPVARLVVDLVPGAQARLLPAQDGLFVVTIRAPRATAPEEARSEAPVGRTSLEGVHIVLDPAGGGDDAGASGGGTTEKAVALDIALRAAVALMNAKALVTLTRDADRSVSLGERAESVRALAPDAVVRVACASGEAKDQGLRTLYTDASEAALATALQRALVSKTHARDLGAAQSADAARLTSGVPTVTVVAGYLSSPGEGKLLATTEYRAKVAAGIAEGSAAYVRRTRK
jgi:N-acetylmuramoyl-L-alanine amidase